MSTKAKETAAPAAHIDPKDLPLTRGQQLKLTAELFNTLKMMHSGALTVPAQWDQAQERCIAIINIAPVHVEQPAFTPKLRTAEEEAAHRAGIAEERSGERLRERY